MRRFASVVFDMDGLLLDTERIALSAFLEACTELGLAGQEELFTRCIGTSASRSREVLKTGLDGRADHLLFEKVWDRNYTERISNEPIPVKDGAVEILDHIAALRIPAAVATSTRAARAREKLQSAGILDRFQAIVGGDEVLNSKPAPDIYLRAAQRLDVRAAACLALEDSENGVRAALAAGMTVVQIPDLVPPSDSLRALGHIVLRSLSDVPTYTFDRQMP
jgi:HAD superfamily hydrolase (TIGR01509 family)